MLFILQFSYLYFLNQIVLKEMKFPSSDNAYNFTLLCKCIHNVFNSLICEQSIVL